MIEVHVSAAFMYVGTHTVAGLQKTLYTFNRLCSFIFMDSQRN